jgi:hypothetical protein
MNLLQKLLRLRDALNIGEQLSKPATWKQRSARLNIVAAFLAVVFPFVQGLENVDQQTINDIAAGVSGIVGLWNWYFHNATSVKVGFKSD